MHYPSGTCPRAIPTRSPTLSDSQPPGMVITIMQMPKTDVTHPICCIDKPAETPAYTREQDSPTTEMKHRGTHP
jgi:hypothetical protein